MTKESTVFVVDDEIAVLRSIAKLLKIIFPCVESYGSAAEFLAAYDGSRPGCLVLDVAMPGMSGLELYKKLTDRNIKIPVIFITGYGNIQMAVSAMRNGAINFLEKPFREQELWDSVRRAQEIDSQNRRQYAEITKIQKRIKSLSPGEREVFHRIMNAKSNKQIAHDLKLSIRTVEDRRSRLMRKLKVSSLVELVQLAQSH